MFIAGGPYRQSEVAGPPTVRAVISRTQSWSVSPKCRSRVLVLAVGPGCPSWPSIGPSGQSWLSLMTISSDRPQS